LEGAVVENIHKSREETQRGDNSEIAEIKREVSLRIRRLDDPNGSLRGARQLRRRPPSEDFRAYCGDLVKRTTSSKGVRLEGGRMVYYEDNIDCFRRRCEGPDSDSRYFGQIRDQVLDKHRAELNGEEFSHEFMRHMYLVGKERRNNPLYSPMSSDERAGILAGRSAVSSDQHRTEDSVPLNQLPGWQAMRAQAYRTPDPPEKGKGKGKNKGKGKGKGKQKGQDWHWRHGDNRPYPSHW